LNIHDELSTLGMNLKARYVLEDNKFLLDGSDFVLGFMHCPIMGDIRTPYDAPKFALNMTFPKLIKSEELLAVFPSGLLRAPYLWLKEHLKSAELRDLAALIEFSEEKGFDVKGQFSFSNLGLTYFGHLPPLQNIKGSGLFTKDIIQFDLDKGMVNKLDFTKSRATITDLAGDIQHIIIDTKLSGDIQNALEVANQKPLAYLDKIGFKPSSFGGVADYHIKIMLPLLKDVYLKDCGIEIDCLAKKITTPIEVLKEKIALYDIKTKITSDKLTLSGDLLFKGQKAQFNWIEFFSVKIQNSRMLKLAGEVNQKIIDLFNVDFFKLQHAVPFTFSYVENAQSKAAKGDLDFNFHNGTLNIPQLGFTQKENQPLKGHANIDFMKGTLNKISSLSLSGEDCDIKGSVLLKNGAINVVDLPKFKLNQTNCSINYAPGQLSLRGDAFYVGGLKFDTNSDKKIPDINLNLDIRNVNAQKGSMLKELKGFLTFRDNKWHMADIAAMTSTLKPIKLHIQPRQSDRVLNFSAEDIGPLCDTLDVLTFMKSGRMNINGIWNDKEKNAPLTAKITASGLKLKEAPAMLKIFSAFSVPGLMNMMSGGQIQFNDLKADIVSQNDVLHIKSLIGTGSSLNVSLNGNIDSKANTIDLKGAIGSSGVIDKILGFIPIIGTILTGTNKLGMFAVKFKVFGSLKDPKVSTNPLSALTPGILREMSSSTGK
ncbi:MAG: AsmA-like C-terminal domain-containing protein, partial [Alphaproteobacteria bacterium]|nr:AsmA-like C-terminal domain-containing protein [Alphaproteobacteria bacterium]